jgi:membrane-bound lytic murein transglycosylase D
LKDFTPPGESEYEMKIPPAAMTALPPIMARLHPVVTTDYKTHVVKKGDTLTAISKRYNINKTTLLKANNLHSAKLLAGQRLRIPYQVTKYVSSTRERRRQAVMPRRKTEQNFSCMKSRKERPSPG